MLSPHSTYILRTTKLSIFSRHLNHWKFWVWLPYKCIHAERTKWRWAVISFYMGCGCQDPKVLWWIWRPTFVYSNQTRGTRRGLTLWALPLLKPFHHHRHSLASPWTITLTFRDGKKFPPVRGFEVLYIEYRIVKKIRLDMSIIFIFVNCVGWIQVYTTNTYTCSLNSLDY